MSQDSGKALAWELIDSVMHSWWTIVAGLCFGLAGALIALHFIPRVYLAEARMRVSPAKMPTEFARATASEDFARRLVTLRELVFGEKFLTRILSKHYGISPTDANSRDRAIRWVRSRIEVDAAPRDGLFTLAFQDDDPQRAATVANALVGLCIEENARSRSESATLVAETLEVELTDVRVNHDRAKRALREYLTSFGAMTEGALEENRRRRETAEERLAENTERQLRQRKTLAELQETLSESSGELSGSDLEALGVDPYEQQLARLEGELKNLLIDYTEKHPDVDKKRREIAALKVRRVTQPDPIEDAPGRAAPPKSPLAKRFEGERAELARMEHDAAKLRAEIAKYDSRITVTPERQGRLDELKGEAERYERRVTELENSLARARSGQELEERQQGEQLEVVELAQVPRRASQPQPVKVLLVGLVAGLALFVGPIPARRFLNPMVASEAGLRAISDLPVLVSIPRVATQETTNFGRHERMRNFGLSLAFAAVLAVILVYFPFSW